MSLSALLVAVCLSGAPEPIPDPVAKVCGTDLDCQVGFICYDNPRYDPRKACIAGCRPKKPRCPDGYVCRKDPKFSFTWHRCFGPDGSPIIAE